MSYILDALRKAEQEREQERVGVPTITTMHFAAEGMGRRFLPWLIVPACLIGGLAAWLVWPSAPTTVPPVNKSDGIEQPAAGKAAEPKTAERGQAERRLQRERTPAPSPPVRPRVTQRPDQEARTARAGETRSVEAPGSVPQVPAPVVAPPPPAPATLTPVPSLREAMAKMTLETFVYMEVPAQRLVVINGRRYVEGQYVDGQYLVETITPKGVLLSYQGERALLTP